MKKKTKVLKIFGDNFSLGKDCASCHVCNKKIPANKKRILVGSMRSTFPETAEISWTELCQDCGQQIVDFIKGK